MSASLIGAWTQTGATALLAAAAVALLYGLVHMFDMVRRRPAVPMPVAVEAAADEPVAVARTVIEELVPEVAELAEPVPPPARKARQPKAPRKKAKAAAVTPVEAVEAVEFVPEDESEVVELVAVEEPVLMPLDEDHHASVTPLFEPEPFVRMQRRAFGRRGRL